MAPELSYGKALFSWSIVLFYAPRVIAVVTAVALASQPNDKLFR